MISSASITYPFRRQVVPEGIQRSDYGGVKKYENDGAKDDHVCPFNQWEHFDSGTTVPVYI